VTYSRRPVPADMLLVAERQRRLTASAKAPIRSDEILVPEEDQLIAADTGAGGSPLHSVGELVLHRPMAYVTLVQVGWSGPIDHTALRSALACQPKDPASADARHTGLATATALRAPDAAGPALEVALHEDDLSLIAALTSSATSEALELISAAHLPDQLTGAEPTTMQAVSHVLAAYRCAALAHAWQRYVGGPQNAQLHRERDEAAVTVLSTLRALLGER
jgi:hypothetical protein